MGICIRLQIYALPYGQVFGIGFDELGKSNASLTSSPEKVMTVYFFA